MHGIRIPGLLALILLCSVAACGSSDTSSNADNGAGEGGASDSGGGSNTPATPYYGSVTFLRGFEFDTNGLQLNADLFVTPSTGIPGLCPAGSPKSGSCCLRPPDRAITGDAPANAGTLTLTDKSTPNAPTLGTATFVISQAPGVPSSYSLLGTDNFDWSSGDMLAVSAAGDTSGVAAFAGSVFAPVDLAGVNPSPGSMASPLSISINSDSVLTWSPGSAPGSQVEVEIDDENNSASIGSLMCITSDSSGQITVPSALTHNIPAGNTGIITVTRVAVGTLSSPASNATISILATSRPVSGYMIYQ